MRSPSTKILTVAAPKSTPEPASVTCSRIIVSRAAPTELGSGICPETCGGFRSFTVVVSGVTCPDGLHALGGNREVAVGDYAAVGQGVGNEDDEAPPFARSY